MTYRIDLFKLFCLSILIYVGLFNSNPAFAFLIHQSEVGSRAQGASGILAPAANDSSAIWYNPAGLNRHDSAAKELSIDLGVPVSKITNKQSDSTYDEINFVGGLINSRLFPAALKPEWLSNRLTLAGAFFPLAAANYVSSYPNNPFTNQGSGLINTKLFQFSLGGSIKLATQLQLGLTLDQLWARFTCDLNSPCLENSPKALGLSAGTSFGPFVLGSIHSYFSLNFHSSAQPGINNIVQHSISEYLIKNQLGRPTIYSAGSSVRLLALSPVIIDLNVVAEQFRWDRSNTGDIHYDNLAGTYRRMGLSSEVHFPLFSHTSMTLRSGGNFDYGVSSQTTSSFAAAAGGGLAWNNIHFLNLAIQKRRLFNDQTVWMPWVASISYGFQTD